MGFEPTHPRIFPDSVLEYAGWGEIPESGISCGHGNGRGPPRVKQLRRSGRSSRRFGCTGQRPTARPRYGVRLTAPRMSSLRSVESIQTMTMVRKPVTADTARRMPVVARLAKVARLWAGVIQGHRRAGRRNRTRAPPLPTARRRLPGLPSWRGLDRRHLLALTRLNCNQGVHAAGRREDEIPGRKRSGAREPNPEPTD